MKCKNIECSNETKNKNIYCCLTCRNIYVNKYLRNYEKCSDTIKKKEKLKEEKYLKDPKLCECCAEIIPYLLKNNKFCNHSCAAKITNGKRDYNWGDKIAKSLDNFFDLNPKVKSKRIGDKRQYELKCECGEIFLRNRDGIKFCSIECRRKYKKNKPTGDYADFNQYKILTNFKFNLADYKEEFDFSLIEKYGWYLPVNRGNNLKGVSRDHMFSVREGFNFGIDPHLIAHPANCRLMVHNDNISKNSKCSISYDELLERINKFEEKYKR